MAKGTLGEGTAFASRKQAAMRCVPCADAVALVAARAGQFKSVIPKRGAFVPKMRSSLPKEALSVTVLRRCHLSHAPSATASARQSRWRGKRPTLIDAVAPARQGDSRPFDAASAKIPPLEPGIPDPGRGSAAIGFDYNLLLMILPLVVFGSSSRNTTMRGYLYGAVFFLT